MISRRLIKKILVATSMSPTVKKEVTKMGIKELVGKRMSKVVKFMGEDIKITKLSVSEVMRIQEDAKGLEKDDSEGFNILRTVIKSSVENAAELTDADFETFPMDELSKLSTEIMKFSGLGEDKQGK